MKFKKKYVFFFLQFFKSKRLAKKNPKNYDPTTLPPMLKLKHTTAPAL